MTETKTTTEKQHTEVTKFWRHLFGGQSGLLMVWTGARGEGGELLRPVEKSFTYPKDAKNAASWALDKSNEGREVYFCAHLLTEPKRIKANASAVISLWGDIDGSPVPNGELKPSALIESSPGRYHAYWRLDTEIPPEVAEELNQRIAAKIGADASGFDLTQLLRVPGTQNHKYPGTPEVRLVGLASDRLYNARELDILLPRTKYDKEQPPPNVGEEIHNGSRNKHLTSIAGALRRRGLGEDAILEALLGINTKSCKPPLARDEVATIARSVGRYEPGSPETARDNSGEKPTTPTHDELRDRFIAAYEDYSFGLGEWQHYSNGVWTRTPEARVKKLTSEIVDAAKTEGTKPTASIVNSVAELTRYKVFVDDDRWDADPDILVCENGALHIPTGELRAHSREHYATSSVPFAFDPAAKAPAWKFLLAGTVPGAADFLQEFAGYALTSDTLHEVALWLYGPPGSGRSTFLTGLEAMLGPRTGILGLADLERSQFALANVAGKTLMTATEQPSSYLASTNVLNALISGETIQVERKFRDPYEITPRAKLAWAMNELPRVGDANSGIFRRVKVVSFPALAPEDRDPEVKERIKYEGPGILNWALEGLARLRERGRFDIPECVEDSTTQFKEHNDIPALFVADKCVADPDSKEKASTLYKEYKFWCEENGHRPQSSTRLADDWQRLGFERKRAKGSTYYHGVRVRLPGE